MYLFFNPRTDVSHAMEKVHGTNFPVEKYIKRKTTVLASTVVNKLYLSFRPFVTHGFCEFSFGSLFTIESRFGSLRVGILIIVSRHCSSDTVEYSADVLMGSATTSQAQKRTHHQMHILHALYFNQLLWDSVSFN